MAGPGSLDADDTDLAAAQAGDDAAFGRLLAAHQALLHAHCYRMLGSVADADDAVQETAVAAWRALGGFEGRSSLRSWLYRIATNAALRIAEQRRRRALPSALGPASTSVHELGDWVTEAVFVEPYPDAGLRGLADSLDPAERYELLESVELAFVAALQLLPATQRAVLVLRDVLAMPAAEVAVILGTSVVSVNSALQRARAQLAERAPARSQQLELRALGDDGARQLVHRLVDAWQRADIEGLVSTLAADARFTMPPLPAWFDGRDAIVSFFAERVLETPWRVQPVTANGQLALACYMRGAAGDFPLSTVNVLGVRDGLIATMDAFLDPAAHRPFGLPPTLP